MSEKRADRVRPRHGSVRVVDGVPRGDRRTSMSLLPLAAEGRWLFRHRDKVKGALLDVGCGNAPYEVWYRDLVDWSCRADIAPLPHLSVASAAEMLPFADATFDTVLSTSVIEHVDDPVRALAEIARVTRPGGHLLISVPFMYPVHEAPYDFRRFTYFGLERAVAEAGFEVVEVGAVGGPVTFVAHLGVMAASAVARAVDARPIVGALARSAVTLPQSAVRPLVSSHLGVGARRISLGYMAVGRRL